MLLCQDRLGSRQATRTTELPRLLHPRFQELEVTQLLLAN
jgi:hypothetical protein